MELETPFLVPEFGPALEGQFEHFLFSPQLFFQPLFLLRENGDGGRMVIDCTETILDPLEFFQDLGGWFFGEVGFCPLEGVPQLFGPDSVIMKGVQIANGLASPFLESFQGTSHGRDVGRRLVGLFLRQGFRTKVFRESFELLVPRRALFPASLQAEKFLLSFAAVGAELFQQGLVALRLRSLTFDKDIEIASLSGALADDF